MNREDTQEKNKVLWGISIVLLGHNEVVIKKQTIIFRRLKPILLFTTDLMKECVIIRWHATTSVYHLNATQWTEDRKYICRIQNQSIQTYTKSFLIINSTGFFYFMVLFEHNTGWLTQRKTQVTKAKQFLTTLNFIIESEHIHFIF